MSENSENSKVLLRYLRNRIYCFYRCGYFLWVILKGWVDLLCRRYSRAWMPFCMDAYVASLLLGEMTERSANK
jgi:hypothetical protein